MKLALAKKSPEAGLPTVHLLNRSGRSWERLLTYVAAVSRPLAACALLGSFVALSSCSPDVSDPTATEPSSFHFKEIGTIRFHQTTIHVERDGYYEAPDSVRLVSASEDPFLEVILIDSQAWTRSSSGWMGADADAVGATVWPEVRGLLLLRDHEDFEDLGPGPTQSGEPTRRYRAVDSTGGEAITTVIDGLASSSPECADLLEPIVDAFRGSESTVEVVIGQRTSNVYSVVTTVAGPELTAETKTSIDKYNSPMNIEPPIAVTPSLQSTPAHFPCP
jgi:hypothetical protein